MQTTGLSLKRFTTFDLKVIGITLMVIDHIYQMFNPLGAPDWLNWFGRPVATIFFFVSVVGFSHTHSKKTYITRLYICSVLMGFGNAILSNIIKYDKAVLMNDIFTDLFVGSLMMLAIDKFIEFKNTKKLSQLFKGIFIFLVPFLLALVSFPMFFLMHSHQELATVMAYLLLFFPNISTAENVIMVLIIPLMYIFKDKRLIQVAIIAITAAIYAYFGDNQWIMVFAIIPILMYNGNKGRGMKYFFYIFYPAHIWILYIIAAVMYNAR